MAALPDLPTPPTVVTPRAGGRGRSRFSAGPGGPAAARPGSRLYRWGYLVAGHARLILGLWLVVVVAGVIVFPRLEAGLATPDFTVRGSDSARAAAVLGRDFPSLGSEQDAIVFSSPRLPATDPVYRQRVLQVLAAAAGSPGVTSVVSPYDALSGGRVAGNGRDALALVNLRGGPTQRATAAAALKSRLDATSGGAAPQVFLTGPSPLNADMVTTQLKDQHLAESIGIPAAFIALLIALGAMVAAVLPVAVALGAVLLGALVMAALSSTLQLDQFALVVGTMVGIGIGIDYALFIVARFREELVTAVQPGDLGAPGSRQRRRADRARIARAVAVALDTSGRTIITAGLLVAMAMGSIVIVRGHVFTEFAACAVGAAGCAVLAGLTLLPALLAVLGDRVNAGRPWAGRLRRSRRASRPAHGSAESGWARWARTVLRHPVLLAGPALVLLLLASVPLSSMRLGLDLGLNSLDHTSSGRGAALVASSFGRGMVAPIDVVACTPTGSLTDADLTGLARLESALRADHRVAETLALPDLLDLSYRAHGAAALAAARTNPALRQPLSRVLSSGSAGQCSVLYVIPADQVDSPQAASLITGIRSTIAPAALAGTPLTVHVGGLTAQYTDLSREASHKLPLVVVIVLLLSFGYLLVAFRSLLLPVKAVLLNLLATAAALGLTVLVFQDGHGSGLLHFTSSGTLQAFLPVALFALLFGLSMDYEVFLVRRMQEEYLRTGDNDLAVTIAVARTGRPITAAAAIMACVFGSFVVANVLELKQMGFVLALAILLDATIIRLLLVPALMGVAGAANWWLPAGLARRLPPPRQHS